MRAFASTKTVPGVTPSSSAITVALDISFLELMARSGEGHPLRAGIAEAHQVAPSIVFEPIVQLLELNAATSRYAAHEPHRQCRPSSRTATRGRHKWRTNESAKHLAPIGRAARFHFR